MRYFVFIVLLLPVVVLRYNSWTYLGHYQTCGHYSTNRPRKTVTLLRSLYFPVSIKKCGIFIKKNKSPAISRHSDSKLAATSLISTRCSHPASAYVPQPMTPSVKYMVYLYYYYYRAMLRRARYCYGKLSVCPSVRNVEVL